MRIPVHIEHLFPDFLLNDHNGYAMAKAIEAALKYFAGTVASAYDRFSNVEQMPEKRLDELAWEYNCLYDYDADIESKRTWIREAMPMYRILGTPEAIVQYLKGYFVEVLVEEWWQYDGGPYHFRVMLNGDVNISNKQWVRKAIERAKNVRSELDAIYSLAINRLIISEEPVISGTMPQMMCSDNLLCGEDWSSET